MVRGGFAVPMQSSCLSLLFGYGNVGSKWNYTHHGMSKIVILDIIYPKLQLYSLNWIISVIFL